MKNYTILTGITAARAASQLTLTLFAKQQSLAPESSRDDILSANLAQNAIDAQFPVSDERQDERRHEAMVPPSWLIKGYNGIILTAIETRMLNFFFG